jgi:twitching motility two-component system response regulator PilG
MATLRRGIVAMVTARPGGLTRCVRIQLEVTKNARLTACLRLGIKGASRRAGDSAALATGDIGMQDEGRNGNLDGLRVMVIDDSKTIRRTAETLLKREGCEVVTATDGFEALAKIADQQPQIIFVDIMMPRLDGYQTCALIKNNQLFKGTPVIMLSSKDGLFDKARGRIVGSEQYLTKPFTREELLDAIRTHVSNA